MTYKTLQTNFERELLFQIIYNMRLKKISYRRAKEVSKVFLPVLKSEGIEEFIKELSVLSRNYPEIMEAFIITVRQYENEKVEEDLLKVRSKLKGGEYYGN